MNNINLIVLISCLGHFFVGSVATTRGIFISSISNYYHLNVIGLGYIYTFFNVGLFVSISATGHLIKLFNLKKLMMYSSSVAIMSILILNVYHTIYSFAFLMLVMGLVSGVNLSGGSYLVIRAIKNVDHGASKLLLTDFFFSLSGMVLPIMFGYLLSQHVIWFTLYNILILPCVAMLYFIKKIDLPLLTHHDQAASDNHAQSPRRTSIYLIVMSSFFFILSESILTLWLVDYFQAKLHLTLVAASLFVTLYWLSKAAGLFVNQFSILKLGMRNYLSISTWIGMLAITMLLQSTNYYPALAALIILGFVSSGILGTLVSYGCSQLDSPCPKTVSLIYSAGTGGALISAWLSSVVVHSYGLIGAMMLAIFAYFICFLCVNLSALMDKFKKKAEIAFATKF